MIDLTNTSEPLVFTRVFDAPRTLVWKVWTDPKHIATWWGPNELTSSNVDWSPRPGGSLHIDMVGPDGTVYPMPGRFVDVKEPELLSFTGGIPDDRDGLLLEDLTEVRFEEQKNKTIVTIRIKILQQKPGSEAAVTGMEEGWSQMLDRLADNVYETGGNNLAARSMSATRVFNAPRELVWECWSDVKHMAHWWGPRGFTFTNKRHEFRVGGQWEMTMHGPDGKDYPNLHTYTEIRKPFRIVHQHGGPQLKEEIGDDFIAIATFEAVGPMQTRVTFTGIFPSAETLAYVVKNYGADQGMHDNLDKLGEYLEKIQK